MEATVLELLEWLVETFTRENGEDGNLGSPVSCTLQGKAMQCGVLVQLQIAALVCCAVDETREEWASMDRLERMQDKLATHEQWTHTSQVAELLKAPSSAAKDTS
jgi:hypothetical protein